jgi:N-acetylmuramate 1-kinase
MSTDSRSKSAEVSWVVDLPTIEATAALARELVMSLRAGDLVTLSGDVGAGKSTFARAMIRELAEDAELEVPSPTFTLMQVYDTPRFRVVHADLYRVKHASELAELGWEEAAEDALVLVEWPEKAGAALAPDRIDVGFILEPEEGPEHRVCVLTGFGAAAPRVQMMKAVDRILEDSGWRGATRMHLTGDAGFRAYERLTRGDETALLMISPPRPDGPAVRLGKPYSAIAHLAEDIRPYLALGPALADMGFSTPTILAADMKAGLAIIEDFGNAFIAEDGVPVADRYAEAVAVLARLHGEETPAVLPVTETVSHTIPAYDQEALIIEVELLPDWYLPHLMRKNISSAARGTFVSLWRTVLFEAQLDAKTWVLRDYHSPNLMWLPERENVRRVGLLDFQDAVLGNPAYDVVSLLQDARVTIEDRMELQLLGHYARLRREKDKMFDLSTFARAYAILGAQRATKILGIFTRLKERDGKPQYLDHMPRVEKYLVKCLAHPVLSDLKEWYQQHLPQLFEEGGRT